MLGAARWVDDLSDANAATRALLFYSLAVIAIGLFSVITRALLCPEIKPKASTVPLRDEPPAVVNLLVNDLSNTADAPTAVLLHLARRDYFSITISEELVETIKVHATQPEAPLRGYERSVLELVRKAATTGPAGNELPVAELQEHCRDRGGADPEWWRAFHQSVTDHAMELGLVARCCSSTMVRILRALAVVVVGIAVLSLGRANLAQPSDPKSWAVGIMSMSALLTFVVLSRLDQDELRYTRLGSRVASDWLSTRSTMQHVGSFADLGPSAVNIWGDRMFYAVATGVARETSRRLTLVSGDGTEAWYVMNERWHHARAAVPKVRGWGESPWKHLSDSALPFLVSAAACGSAAAIVWFGKLRNGGADRTGLQSALDQVLHFPERLTISAIPQLVTMAVFVGLLWVLRGHLRRAAPIYRAGLDLLLARREQGVIAYEKDGWIGIGNPHSRSMTLYLVPPGLAIERGGLVELTATRFFGRVKAVRAVEPAKPRKRAFS